MTRPLTNTVEYFFHSCHHGKTLFILEQRFGNDGYSFWFKLLESLGNAENHFLDLNDPLTFETLQAKAKIKDGITTYSLLDLLALLQAIDPPLWKEKIVWSENFVQGLSQVYKNRKRDLPVKPFVIPSSITINKDVVSTNSYPDKEGITTGSLPIVNPLGIIGSKGSKEKVLKPLVPIPENPESGRLSHLLFDLILERDSKAKKPDFGKWNDHTEKLIRIDKRDPADIEKVIRWCQADSFWKTNIRSTEKLRAKFERLFDQMNTGPKSKSETDYERQDRLRREVESGPYIP